MRPVGILRRVDELGRVVLPKELRMAFDINPGDSLEIYTDDDNTVVLKKYQKNCIFCGSTSTLREYMGRLVCENCIKNVNDNKKSRKI